MTTTPRPNDRAPNALRPVDGAAPADAPGIEESQDRPISIVGIVQFGSGAAEAGWFELLSIVALVNIALALIKRTTPVDAALVVTTDDGETAAAQETIVPPDAGRTAAVPRLPRLSRRR